MPKAPTAPKGLGTKARKTWREITTNYELRADELRVLEDTCREIDLVDAMQEALDDPDARLVVAGSMKQDVANPLVQEIRQHRAVIQRLFASLKLSELDDPAGAANERSSSARHAAQVRWGAARGA